MYSAVQLEFRSTNPANSTVVVITEIGDAGFPLICATELIPCCASINNRFGDWYFANGSEVRRNNTGDSFYRSRRDAVENGVSGAALLHRRYNAMGPVGIYRCNIPDGSSMAQNLYVGLYATATNGSTCTCISERAVVHLCHLLLFFRCSVGLNKL